jgi:hypothetical protein
MAVQLRGLLPSDIKRLPLLIVSRPSRAVSLQSGSGVIDMDDMAENETVQQQQATAAVERVPVPEVSSTARPAPHHSGGLATRGVGKIRSPLGVWALSIVTFGIYGLVWYFKVNSECREYEPTVQVQPGISVLALFVPIAGWVSIAKTGGRISQVQRAAGLRDRCSGLVGLLLTILFGLHVVYYQAALNKVWERHGSQPAGSHV